MHPSDVVWWGYTAFLVCVVAFMLFFASKVRAKGG
jgi:ABC-type multidrug transport system permease subunit